MGGAINAMSAHASGTPVCFSEKRNTRFWGGVKRISKCADVGVIMVTENPRNSDAITSAMMFDVNASRHPSTQNARPTCVARQAPQRFTPVLNHGADSVAAPYTMLIW